MDTALYQTDEGLMGEPGWFPLQTEERALTHRVLTQTYNKGPDAVKPVADLPK